MEEMISIGDLEKRVSKLEKIVIKKDLQQRENLTFGEAIQILLDEDAKISCWTPKDVYVFLGNALFEHPVLMVRTLSEREVPWIPNHFEMLEAKWRVVG